MKNLFKLSVQLSTAAALFSGCGIHSPTLTGNAPAPVQIQEQAGLQNVTLSPKVDVLLVVDNSESMEVKQDFLIKYIHYFTNALSANQTLDIHLGVVPIYDGTRYGTAGSRNFLSQPFVCTSDQPYDMDNQTGFYARGAMRPLVDPASGKRSANGPKYFTHVGSDNIDQIDATLHIGVDHYIAPTSSSQGSGPEFEEMFSPVAAALYNPTGGDNPNPGFYRDDAALVVIILTDGEDPDNKQVCTEIGSNNQIVKKPYYAACDSNGLATYLTNLKHKDQSRLFTYGVLIPSSGETNSGCQSNPSIKRDNSMVPPTSIERLLVTTGGTLANNELDLCKDQQSAGDALTRFGDTIQRAASIQKIPLNATPDMKQPFIVTYNGEDISNNPDVQIDSAHNQLIIQPTIKLARPTANGQLTIKFTPANAKFSHSHVLGQ